MKKELQVICAFGIWLGALILALFLAGCSTKEPSTQIGENAKESITIAYNNLPKECKSPEREREFNNAVNQVDALVQTCEIEKIPFRQRIRYQTVALYALGSLSLLLFLGLLRKILV